MLTLNDGRSELWQWDTGRTLAVDADCSQVHFSNKVFGRSIDVDVIGGSAIIPDVLLQTDKDLNVWAFVGTAENGYTKISKTFKVNRRNKPADYVFTPTEQTTLAELVEQIGNLDELTTEAKDNLVAAINEVAKSGGGGSVQPDWNQNDDTQPDYIKNKPLIVISFKPAGKYYLTFSSPSSFTLKVNDATKHWDGTLEYFAPDKTWTVWDGTTTLSAVAGDGEYVLYLRGTGNTVITGSSENYRWVLTGSDIKCIGNIENLLDYATVESGNHPTMASYCYKSMFYGCTSLIQAPALPATTLERYCYAYMFYGCTSLTKAPALPATTLASYCYYYMFSGCTSLIQAPALPATTLAISCYNTMFYGCTSLTKAPALPATTLARGCYTLMFYHCTSLTQAPALPATTLEADCYTSMFSGCTSLTQVPDLPATTLKQNCYRWMFQDCTSLKLSTTQSDEYAQEYRIPSSGEGVEAINALKDMFTSTGGTFTGTPAINTTYYLSSDNMIVRETEIDTLNGYVGSMIDVAIAEHTSNPLNINGAIVGQIAKITAVDENGKPTAWSPVDMPVNLPNPHALTFTGAVTGTYDGSEAKTINIPSGGGDIALGITGATVDQIVKIKSVDDTGKPTAWEAVDLPTGGGGGGETWEAINAITLIDAVNTVTINTDSGGNAIALKKVRILVEGSASTNQDIFFNNSRYIRANVVGSTASVGALSAEPFCGKMYCFAVTNINANYGASSQMATTFSDEITITEIKLIVNNDGTFSAGTKFTIQGVRA